MRQTKPLHYELISFTSGKEHTNGRKDHTNEIRGQLALHLI